MFAFVNRLEKYNNFMDHNSSTRLCNNVYFCICRFICIYKRLFTQCIFVLLASAAIIQCDAKQLESERYMNSNLRVKHVDEMSNKSHTHTRIAHFN